VGGCPATLNDSGGLDEVRAGPPQAARPPLTAPDLPPRPLPSHVGERGRLSWATAGESGAQERPASTHTPPDSGPDPTWISGVPFWAPDPVSST
jgi:hypothetical protein